MRDEDYIPASERNHEDVCQHELLDGDEPCNCMRASHAIADDVMRDLAKALRRSVYAACPVRSLSDDGYESGEDCGECSICERMQLRQAALARYDALAKETR